MSGKKIPEGAFEHYLSLGPGRSYAQVAQHYGVSKQAVVKRATKERWQERIARIEAKARVAAEGKAVEAQKQIADQSLKAWRLAESRAVQALSKHTLDSGMDGVRALDLATKNIRLIQGDPTDRVETVEQIVRREAERLLTTSVDDDWSRFEVVREEGDATSEAR